MNVDAFGCFARGISAKGGSGCSARGISAKLHAEDNRTIKPADITEIGDIICFHIAVFKSWILVLKRCLPCGSQLFRNPIQGIPDCKAIGLD